MEGPYTFTCPIHKFQNNYTPCPDCNKPPPVATNKRKRPETVYDLAVFINNNSQDRLRRRLIDHIYTELTKDPEQEQLVIPFDVPEQIRLRVDKYLYTKREKNGAVVIELTRTKTE